MKKSLLNEQTYICGFYMTLLLFFIQRRLFTHHSKTFLLRLPKIHQNQVATENSPVNKCHMQRKNCVPEMRAEPRKQTLSV